MVKKYCQSPTRSSSPLADDITADSPMHPSSHDIRIYSSSGMCRAAIIGMRDEQALCIRTSRNACWIGGDEYGCVLKAIE